MSMASHSSRRCGIVGVALLFVFASIISTAPSAIGEEEENKKSWEGGWNNRKYGTNGPIKCTVSPKDEKTWEAHFEGTGLGKPFSYNVTLETLKKGDRTLLQGTARISGDVYRWTGYIRGKVFFGKYRSASGNNGQFKMQEMRN
jgi:hypothetical protein